MNLIETIKTNPAACDHALTTVACVAVVGYFVVLSHNSIASWVCSLVVPISVARGVVSAFMSVVHFLRGPVPVNPPSSTVPVFSSTNNTTPTKA